jgi:hypothetical protein
MCSSPHTALKADSRDFHDAYPVVTAQRWPVDRLSIIRAYDIVLTPVLRVEVPASAQPGPGIGCLASLVAGEGGRTSGRVPVGAFDKHGPLPESR